MTGRIAKTSRLLAGAVCIASLCLGGHGLSADETDGATRHGRPGVARHADTVNFSELARLEPTNGTPARITSRPQPAHGPWPRATPSIDASVLDSLTQSLSSTTADPLAAASFSPAAIPPSPSASASFPALPDNGTRFNPDTQGAVGPNHIMTTLQNGVRIHDRFGTPISTVTLEAFWASVGVTAVFDPRVLFDPVAQRWIHTAAANPVGNNPGLLVAVSVTSDPTGAWRRYFVDTDAGAALFADSPRVGLTKDWITVQANLFRQDTSDFSSAGIWALNKTNFYAGGQGRFTFFKYSVPGLGPMNAPVPAVTYDDNYPTNYLIANWVGNFQDVGYLRLFTISGPVGAEVFDDFPPNGFYVNGAPIGNPPWSDYSPFDDNFAPQLGATNKIYVGDARIQNAVFRNGALWCTHTVFLPYLNPTRSAVQWWSISPGANVLQRGRVDDASGVNFFAYPSLAVNTLGDALVGYSRFSASQYPSANYSFHGATDGPGNLRGDTVLKDGEGKWAVADGSRVRWGDWSGTVVDPVNDLDFWTIQEFGAAPSGGGDRWGTWWGRVAPPVNLGVAMTGSPTSISAGGNVTYTIRATNNNAIEASGAKILDTLPAGAGFISATSTRGACGHTNGIVVCDFGPLPAGGSATVTLVASLNLPGSTTNTVVVAANGPDAAPSDNTARVTTTVNPAVDIFPVLQSIPNPPLLSNNFILVVTVTNRGPSAATAVTLTNTLPLAVNFISLATSQGTCNRNGSIITCNLGNIASMGAVDVSVLVSSTSSAFLTNRAAVGTTALDAVPGNNSTSLVVRIDVPPTIGPISNRSMMEDSVLGPIPFTVGDLETPAASLTLAGFSSNPAIVPATNITFDGAGTSRTLSLTPAPDANGIATIFYVVTDLDGASATNSFVLSITAANDRPVVSDISDQTANEDSIVGPINFVVSDPETPAASLVVTASSSNPALVPNGNLVLGGNGPNRRITMTPAANQTGITVITLSVSDGALTTIKTFNLTVNAVNDLPTINHIPNRAINEDSSTGFLALNINDLETPASALVLSSASSNPTLVPTNNIVFGGTGQNRTVSITPAQNQFGTATITLTVTDGNGGSTNDVFVLTVNPVNDPPTLNTPAGLSIQEDSGDSIVNLSGIGPGGTNENQILTVTATSSNPALIPNPRVAYTNGSTTGTLTLAPTTNASGSAVITVSVNDGAASNNIVSRTFGVTVNAANDPPTITELADQSINEDGVAGPLAFVIGDVDSPLASLALSGRSSNPTLVPATNIVFAGSGSNRTVTITPAANQNGSATIQVLVSDGSATNIESLLLTVLPVNDPPAISPIPVQTMNEDTTLQVAFTANDLETNPNVLTYSIQSSNEKLLPPANATFGGNGTNRFVRLSPTTNQYGSAVIQITATDASALGASTSFVLNVSPINDPPTLNPILDVTLDENAPTRSISLTGISAGAPNESQAVSLSAVSDNLVLIPNPRVTYVSPNATALLQITPAPNASGVANITVTLDDGDLVNNLLRQTFKVTVNSVNQVPTISTIVSQTIDEDGEAQVGFTIGDLETSDSSLTVTADSSNQELIDSSGLLLGGTGASRLLTIHPLTNQYGSATITLTVTDGNGGSATSAFELRVQPRNDPPSISNPADVALVPEVTTPVAFTVSDQDTPPTDLGVTAVSSNPALVPQANLQLIGTGASRTLMIRSANQTGTAIITLTVSDGTLTNNSSFNVSVGSDTLRPPLQIALAGTNVIVSWSTNSGPAWELQTNANAASTEWSLAHVSPSVSGSRYQVPLPATGLARFFRLCRDCGGVSPPALSIARNASGIVVSWPAAPDAFILEARSVLDVGGSWTTAAETPQFANGFSMITVNATGTDRYFRLRTK